MFGYYLDLALRSLRRSKTLATMMVMALAVGIGASMTTLTVAHLLSGDPVPGHSATLYHPQLNPTMPPRLVHEPTSAMDYRSAMDLSHSTKLRFGYAHPIERQRERHRRSLQTALSSHDARRQPNQSSVKAMILLPRLKSICVLPPAPTTMYCLLSSE